MSASIFKNVPAAPALSVATLLNDNNFFQDIRDLDRARAGAEMPKRCKTT
jgi:hypothetical protein